MGVRSVPSEPGWSATLVTGSGQRAVMKQTSGPAWVRTTRRPSDQGSSTGATLRRTSTQAAAGTEAADPAGRALYKRFINELIPRPLNHGAAETFPAMAAAIQKSKFAGK